MINKLEIIKAIVAHDEWKNELAKAIKDGWRGITPDQIERDNECGFGKWLYGLSLADKGSEHFNKVQSLHAAFHIYAARVLRLASCGETAAAEKSLGVGELYAKTSDKLVAEMRDWIKAIESKFALTRSEAPSLHFHQIG